MKNAAQQRIGAYEFDGEGRRVKKTSSTEVTIFVYNAAGTLIAEYSTQMAQVQQVSYLTNDHLGSPRVITNENGAVTSRQDFSAFGDRTLTVQRTEALGCKPDELRKDYTGYEKDDETGLEFAQARFYNPKHGRFTSVDPLTASANVKDPQTFNRYSYALNSPYKFTDPLGLISEHTGAHGNRGRFSGSSGGGMVSTYGNAFQSILGTAFSQTQVVGSQASQQTQQEKTGYFFNDDGLLVCNTGCLEPSREIHAEDPPMLIEAVFDPQVGSLETSAEQSDSKFSQVLIDGGWGGMFFLRLANPATEKSLENISYSTDYAVNSLYSTSTNVRDAIGGVVALPSLVITGGTAINDTPEVSSGDVLKEFTEYYEATTTVFIRGREAFEISFSASVTRVNGIDKASVEVTNVYPAKGFNVLVR